MALPKLDAAVFIRDHGWNRERMAIAMGVQTPQVAKYLGGHRRISPRMKTALLCEFGDAAFVFVDICDRAFAVTSAAPKPATKTRQSNAEGERTIAYAYARDEHDGKTYTIEEWKRLFGEPGGRGPDINGRFSGFFDTEPCWLGE